MVAIYCSDRWERQVERMKAQHEQEMRDIRRRYALSRPTGPDPEVLRRRREEEAAKEAAEEVRTEAEVAAAFEECQQEQKAAVAAYEAVDFNAVVQCHRAMHQITNRFLRSDFSFFKSYNRHLMSRIKDETGHRHYGYFLAYRADLYPAFKAQHAGLVRFAMDNSFDKAAQCHGGGLVLNKERSLDHLRFVWARFCPAVLAAVVGPMRWAMNWSSETARCVYAVVPAAVWDDSPDDVFEVLREHVVPKDKKGDWALFETTILDGMANETRKRALGWAPPRATAPAPKELDAGEFMALVDREDTGGMKDALTLGCVGYVAQRDGLYHAVKRDKLDAATVLLTYEKSVYKGDVNKADHKGRCLYRMARTQRMKCFLRSQPGFVEPDLEEPECACCVC